MAELDERGADKTLVHVPRPAAERGDRLRVHVRETQETVPYGPVDGQHRAGVGIRLDLWYDQGDARVALLDLERVYKRAKGKLEAALRGQR